MSQPGVVAIVTGAAGAIGRSVLRTLAEQGVVVVALDASVQDLADEEDLYPGQILPFTADVTAPGAAACAIALVVERLGAPQILVNLAGPDVGVEFAKVIALLVSEDSR